MKTKSELQNEYNQALLQLGLLQLNKHRNLTALNVQMDDLCGTCLSLEKEAEQLDLVEKATAEAIAKALPPQQEEAVKL